LNNEYLNNYYTYPNILRVIKSVRMIWVGHVAAMDVERGIYRALVGKTEGRKTLGSLIVDGWIIYGRISRE